MASLTYAQALAAFNAVMAADPLQRALESGAAWGDVMYEHDLKKPQSVCPWAPKKQAPTPSRCMVSGCSYRGRDLDQYDICRACYNSNNSLTMRAPSEMTMEELETAHQRINESLKYARRSGNEWEVDNLNIGAAAIQKAKDALYSGF